MTRSDDRGHTKRYLQEQFAQRGLFARTHLGQNFLTDLNLVDLLVEAADLSGDDIVFEVGTGTGGLTQRLASRAAAVLSVELDPGLYQFALEALGDLDNLTLLHADVLRNKNALNPEVLQELDRLISTHPHCRLKLVANLPYNVAAPVLVLALLSPFRWDRMVVTIQKEMADRLVASPATRSYGTLSVIAQALARVERIRDLSPNVFWPRPKVDSSFVSLTPDREKRAQIEDLPRFHVMVRSLMTHRRKNIRGALRSALGSDQKTRVDEFLEQVGLMPQLRAEALNVDELRQIAAELPDGWFQAATD